MGVQTTQWWLSNCERARSYKVRKAKLKISIATFSVSLSWWSCILVAPRYRVFHLSSCSTSSHCKLKRDRCISFANLSNWNTRFSWLVTHGELHHCVNLCGTFSDKSMGMHDVEEAYFGGRNHKLACNAVYFFLRVSSLSSLAESNYTFSKLWQITVTPFRTVLCRHWYVVLENYGNSNRSILQISLFWKLPIILNKF